MVDIVSMLMAGGPLVGGSLYLINEKGTRFKWLKTVKKTSMALGVAGLIGFSSVAGFIGMGDTTSVNSVSASDLVVSSVYFSEDANVAGSTSLDYYNSDDSVASIYAVDASYADDGNMNITLNIERMDSSEAGSVKLLLKSSDFTHTDGTTKNILSKNALNQIEATINAGGRAEGDNAVYKMIDFAEGVSSATASISLTLDEAGHDALQSFDSKEIVLEIDGKKAVIEIINNE